MKYQTAPSRDSFRISLTRAISRVPADREIDEASGRVRNLLRIFDDIRNGRNGMRQVDIPPLRRTRLKVVSRGNG